MKFSYRWLQEFLPIEISANDFCNRLTMFGLEVEKITDMGAALDNIVVGKIEKINEHPNADKLSVCMVDVGEDSSLQIICGAPNIEENQKVPVAKVGAKLGENEITSVKLRGVKSYGMICSEKELNLSEDHSGIMVLNESLNVGTQLAKALELDDYIIEVEVTPNRPDLLGILGIARESAAMLEKDYSNPATIITEVATPASELISVNIKNSELCSRYTARVIKDVKVKPSPLWLQKKLRSVGMRPINNIVDVTNYILMEQGHPIHAFDLDKVEDNKIIVRQAEKGEKITLLDEETYKLNPNNLVIADSKKPMALAGIMGGTNSSINQKTTDIVLECACFNALNIRNTSRELKVESDSSYRFERIMDPNRLKEIINRTAYLIQQTAGGKITKGIVDNYPEKIKPKKITLRPERANDLLKTDIKTEIMKHYLENLELEVISKDNVLEVTVPTFRPDITREIDLIEEISRSYGYNNIDSSYDIERIENSLKRIMQRKMRNFLVNQGFYEVCNLSFSSQQELDRLQISEDHKLRNAADLKNPLGDHFSIMRTTLIPDLLQNIAHNLSQNFQNFKLFELNKVYFQFNNNTEEAIHLTGSLVGNYFESYWKEEQDKVDFFDVKGIVECLLNNIFELQENFIDFSHTAQPYYANNLGAEIKFKNKFIGSLGKINRDVLIEYDIEEPVWLFDLDFSSIFALLPKEKFNYEPISKFPSLIRDAALVAPKAVPVAEIVDIITSVKPGLIKNVELFDVYEGEQIDEQHRSLAFRIEFQSKEKTLTDKYVDKIFDKIIDELDDKKKITLRR